MFWPEQSQKAAVFTNIDSGPKNVYIAKTTVQGQSYWSYPFQLTPDAGVSIDIYLLPRTMFNIQGYSGLDDEKLWFEFYLSIANPGIAPIRGGVSIPLPKGFILPEIKEEEMVRKVAINDTGLFWRDAFPSGQRDFTVVFALPADRGEVTFDLALPHGMENGSYASSGPIP